MSRTFATGLMFSAVVALSISLHGQSQPARLTSALKALPNVRVLNESDVRESLKDLKELGYWPPWVVADMDGVR